MEKYQEVNWSEICRKAVVDYVDTRSHMDIGPILEKLKAERNESYKQGQIFFYELAPKLALKDFESWYPDLNLEILEGRPSDWPLDDEKLSPEVARYQAPKNMRKMISRYRDLLGEVPFPQEAPTSFWEGALAAFMNIYRELHPKKT